MNGGRARWGVSAPDVDLYVAVWAGYFALIGLLPVRYSHLERLAAVFSLIFWVLISAAVAYAVRGKLQHGGFMGHPASLRVAGRPLQKGEVARIVSVGMALGVVGFGCLAYDRIVLQGIDYSQGIAVARELWRQSGENRNGVSSVFSVLGYLVGFSFFCSIAIAHFHWEFLGKWTRRMIIFGGTLLVMANSLLIGGRSVVLVQLAAVVAMGCIRRLYGYRSFPGNGARIFLLGGAIFVLAFGYSIYVFSERAAAGNTLPAVYSEVTIDWLGGEPTDSFRKLEELPDSLASSVELAVVAGVYLSHSYGTFESVLESDNNPGTVTFGFIRELLGKMGLAAEPSEASAFEARFLSLPGSLYYDFGWMGFYLGALFMGLLLGFIPNMLRWRSGGGMAICLALSVLITAFLAPLLLAMDVLCVPFMVLGFALVDLVHRLFGGQGNWMAVGRLISIRPPRGSPRKTMGIPTAAL